MITMAALVRTWRNVPQTSGADMLIAIAIFDAAAIAGPHDFSRLIASLALRPHIVQIHLVMLGVTAIIWMFAVLKVEPFIARGRGAVGDYTGRQWAAAFTGAIASVALIAVHLITYRGKF